MTGVAFGSSGNPQFRPAGSETETNRNALETDQRNTGPNSGQRNENPRDATSVFDRDAVTATNRLSASAERDNQTSTQPASAAAEEEGPPSAGGEELTEEEQARVEELQRRDREVRAHEQAHARVGGPYAGAPTYTLETGPDGQQYAVAGEVQIDAAPIEGDPQASIQKLQTVIRAALAPREPSSQDRAVARQAQADLRESQAALREENQTQLEEALDGGGASEESGEGGNNGSGQNPNNANSNAANIYSAQQQQTAAQSASDGGLLA